LPNNRRNHPQYDRKTDDRNRPSPISRRTLQLAQGFRPLAEISTSGSSRIALKNGS
jgi:hypothetical protein